MEQTALDISSLKFGNFMLDRWLNDEAGFWKSLLSSLPCQICMVEVYKSLVKAGDIQKGADEDMRNEKTIDAEKEVMKWGGFPDQLKKSRLIKAMIVLSTLSELRLKVTIGV